MNAVIALSTADSTSLLPAELAISLPLKLVAVDEVGRFRALTPTAVMANASIVSTASNLTRALPSTELSPEDLALTLASNPATLSAALMSSTRSDSDWLPTSPCTVTAFAAAPLIEIENVISAAGAKLASTPVLSVGVDSTLFRSLTKLRMVVLVAVSSA